MVLSLKPLLSICLMMDKYDFIGEGVNCFDVNLSRNYYEVLTYICLCLFIRFYQVTVLISLAKAKGTREKNTVKEEGY